MTRHLCAQVTLHVYAHVIRHLCARDTSCLCAQHASCVCAPAVSCRVKISIVVFRVINVATWSWTRHSEVMPMVEAHARHCNTLHRTWVMSCQGGITRKTLQDTAPHCNTLESCRIYKWVMWAIHESCEQYMSHVSNTWVVWAIHESCEQYMSRLTCKVWMLLLTCKRQKPSNRSRLWLLVAFLQEFHMWLMHMCMRHGTFERVVAHGRMRHGTCGMSRGTYKCGWVVTRMNASSRTWKASYHIWKCIWISQMWHVQISHYHFRY